MSYRYVKGVVNLSPCLLTSHFSRPMQDKSWRQLEDYRERDKIRDAELALVKEKLAIVISSFETEKQRLLQNIRLIFTRTKRNLLNKDMLWHL